MGRQASREHRLSKDRAYASVGDWDAPKTARKAIEVRSQEPTTAHPVTDDAPNALASLDRARVALMEARTLPEVKKIRDIAEAARVYAKAAHLGRESQNYAAEIALLASHKRGRNPQQTREIYRG